MSDRPQLLKRISNWCQSINEFINFYNFKVLIPNLIFCVCLLCVLDHDLDDLEQVVRYKPEGLDSLLKNTKFTKKELQIMYRGFKQVGWFFNNFIQFTSLSQDRRFNIETSIKLKAIKKGVLQMYDWSIDQFKTS